MKVLGSEPQRYPPSKVLPFLAKHAHAEDHTVGEPR